MSKREAPTPPVCEITMQYRRRGGYVYELTCAGVPLEVHIAPNTAPEGGWRVDAQSGHGSEPVVVCVVAETPAEALRGVGASLVERAPELAPVARNWDAVTEALTDVRAL